MSSPERLRLSNHSPSSPSLLSSTSTQNERFPSLDHTINDGPFPFARPQEISATPARPLRYVWPSRKASQRALASRFSAANGSYKHRTQRSVSEALDNFRTRSGSVSENAQELAEALKAPISYRLIALCIAWYMTSALTNTSSKSILNAFPKPVTLTIVQFACVSLWCLLLAYLASLFPSLKRTIPALKNGIRHPTTEVLSTALPLSVFQLLGHLLSSYATSRIPVSLVHTIKGLSPLFTVLAYRIVFRISYARATYLSLVPLTIGVMMACSTDFSTNFLGISCAFVAAIVFVTQNIYSKKLFTEISKGEAEATTPKTRKPDKLNLLCYCSAGAFILTMPVWLFSEGFAILRGVWQDGVVVVSTKKGALDHGALCLEFMFNGIFHFGQNMMAFILLSMLSPVSYSVASLVKRVWVIVVTIFWFRSNVTSVQAFGIGLTFLGLYLYDRTSMEDAAERRAKADYFRNRAALLPLSELPESKTDGHAQHPDGGAQGLAYEFPGKLFKRGDDHSDPPRQGEGNFSSSWLPPGTKQESTWEVGDCVQKAS